MRELTTGLAAAAIALGGSTLTASAHHGDGSMGYDRDTGYRDDFGHRGEHNRRYGRERYGYRHHPHYGRRWHREHPYAAYIVAPPPPPPCIWTPQGLICGTGDSGGPHEQLRHSSRYGYGGPWHGADLSGPERHGYSHHPRHGHRLHRIHHVSFSGCQWVWEKTHYVWECGPRQQ